MKTTQRSWPNEEEQVVRSFRTIPRGLRTAMFWGSVWSSPVRFPLGFTANLGMWWLLHCLRRWVRLFCLQVKMRGRLNLGCQVMYLALLGTPELEAAEAAAWLPRNRGSKQATLAAKKEWMQWRTAKRFENSSSWKGQRDESHKIKINFLEINET